MTCARTRLAAVAAAIGFGLLAVACGQTDPPPMGAEHEPNLSTALAYRDGEPRIAITRPIEGEILRSPVILEVEALNLELSPPGETQDGQGHLHVFVDDDCLQPGLVIPSDVAGIHVGDGSGSTVLDLEPGPHDICVQIGDGFHVAVAVVDRVSINVIDTHGGPPPVGS